MLCVTWFKMITLVHRKVALTCSLKKYERLTNAWCTITYICAPGAHNTSCCMKVRETWKLQCDQVYAYSRFCTTMYNQVGQCGKRKKLKDCSFLLESYQGVKDCVTIVNQDPYMKGCYFGMKFILKIWPFKFDLYSGPFQVC